jgi:hypothetical protein
MARTPPDASQRDDRAACEVARGARQILRMPEHTSDGRTRVDRTRDSGVQTENELNTATNPGGLPIDVFDEVRLWAPLQVPTFRHLLLANVLPDIGTYLQRIGAA